METTTALLVRLAESASVLDRRRQVAFMCVVADALGTTPLLPSAARVVSRSWEYALGAEVSRGFPELGDSLWEECAPGDDAASLLLEQRQVAAWTAGLLVSTAHVLDSVLLECVLAPAVSAAAARLGEDEDFVASTPEVLVASRAVQEALRLLEGVDPSGLDAARPGLVALLRAGLVPAPAPSLPSQVAPRSPVAL